VAVVFLMIAILTGVRWKLSMVLILFLSCWADGVLLRKLLPSPMFPE
jgi:hypothetical protein